MIQFGGADSREPSSASSRLSRQAGSDSGADKVAFINNPIPWQGMTDVDSN